MTIYIPKKKRVQSTKLAAKGMPGIFLSLTDTSKNPPGFHNFKVFSFVDKKVLRTPGAHVTFKTWDFGNVSWKRNQTKEILSLSGYCHHTPNGD